MFEQKLKEYTKLKPIVPGAIQWDDPIRTRNLIFNSKFKNFDAATQDIVATFQPAGKALFASCQFESRKN